MEKEIDKIKKGSLLTEILNKDYDKETDYEELSDNEKIEEEKFMNKFKQLFV